VPRLRAMPGWRSWRPVLIAAVAGFAAAVDRIFEKNDRAALINIGDYEPLAVMLEGKNFAAARGWNPTA
jgi:hypothetical protein